MCVKIFIVAFSVAKGKIKEIQQRIPVSKEMVEQIWHIYLMERQLLRFTSRMLSIFYILLWFTKFCNNASIHLNT